MVRKPISESDVIEFEDPNLKHGFAQVPRPVLKARGLSDRAKVLYALLLDYAWREGSCFPGQSRLAEDLDVNERTIQRSLTELRDYKLINWKRRGLSQTNLYYILDLSKSPNLTNSRDNRQAAKPVSTLDTTDLSYQKPTDLSHQDPTDLSYKEYPEVIDTGLLDSPAKPNREISLSKFRKGTPKDFESDSAEGNTKPSRVHQPIPGFERVASMLANRGSATPTQTVTRASQMPDSTPAPVSPLSTSTSMKSTPSPRVLNGSVETAPEPQYPEERALLLAYIRDYASEFHDQAQLKSSVTRALHIFQRADLPIERWTQMLYEAHSTTKERYAAIGHQGTGKSRAGITNSGQVNRMPYFYSVLECVLGLHDHPAGQHPLPLSATEFKRQQSRGARRENRPPKIPSAPQRTLAEQNGEPDRPSLAGKYANLVHR